MNEGIERYEPGDLVATACELQHRYDGSRDPIPHGTSGIVLDVPPAGRYIRVELSTENAPRWISPVNLRLVERGFLSFDEAQPAPAVTLLWDLTAEQGAVIDHAQREIQRLRGELSTLLKYETGVRPQAHAGSDGLS